METHNLIDWFTYYFSKFYYFSKMYYFSPNAQDRVGSFLASHGGISFTAIYATSFKKLMAQMKEPRMAPSHFQGLVLTACCLSSHSHGLSLHVLSHLSGPESLDLLTREHK